ncbi:GDP-mannose 6-dehydrogenase [Methylobacterium gregans]|uniref:UDP-glucose 6-dehydrogenase n=2 Tax=Methylobacterium gregans TaxID=374424 RepID=A0AA37MDZ4_9HYPH|nr:nucleotide sugar dehydrogenase [Methylobacterium gregans]MDQ0523195.1 GDP-mannose 6-dehydrogenase [Methylobacterium gregans]GJD80643.1 GDP-mannose 6-dehydrogenase [Methylobacterium gregans]GLS53586.1 GDP-mannose 6-dehydrogenase [Methylobacterium gregans]
MNVSVFGLGYVGTVCSACLAHMGHNVVGVDLNETKVDLMSRGHAPIVERDVAEYVADAVSGGRLRATLDVEEAARETDLSLICVGTPSRPNGSLDTRAVEGVARQIGRAIARKNTYHSVVVRSTVLPGTVRGRVLPILESESGGRAGERFGLASNPEFMREGTAVTDFYDPPKTVIGEVDPETAERLVALYDGLPGPVFRTSLEIAEMAKYADNVWHALKVTFGNEIGAICKKEGIDSHRLMEMFCADTKLNISKAYLKPGFAFGGSCLPKDTRALAHHAVSRDLDLPVIANIARSNREQIERGIDWILDSGARSVCFLGFSFKAGTDDLRESPYLDMIERLLGKGCQIKVFDRNVELAKLTGANRSYLYGVIPHVAELMVDNLEEALAGTDSVVVTANAPEYRDAVDRIRPGQRVLDFARLAEAEALGERYDGFLW